MQTTAQWTCGCRHSTLQPHGLFALAKHLLLHYCLKVNEIYLSKTCITFTSTSQHWYWGMQENWRTKQLYVYYVTWLILLDDKNWPIWLYRLSNIGLCYSVYEYQSGPQTWLCAICDCCCETNSVAFSSARLPFVLCNVCRRSLLCRISTAAYVIPDDHTSHDWSRWWRATDICCHDARCLWVWLIYCTAISCNPLCALIFAF